MYITKYTDEWLSLSRQTETANLPAASGRVPKVSETTVVKGQYGLKQSRRMGIILKILSLQECPTTLNLPTTLEEP